MIPELTPAEIRRFYSKVALAGCGQLWTGPVNNHGYGRFEFYRQGRRVRVLAHRMAYWLATGDDPGRVLRHGCDTPPCCTPDCLESGTQRQNVHDAITRGRFDGSGLLIPRRTWRAAAKQRIDVGIKRCRCCGVVKPLAEFHRNSRAADGRQYYCKGCMSEHLRTGCGFAGGLSERERRRLKRDARMAA